MKFLRIGLSLAFWIPLGFATYMAWAPLDHLDVPRHHDKIMHFWAFGYLTGAFAVVYARWTTWLRTAGIMFAYGGMIEVVQAFIPYRSCSLLDIVADGIGISLALSGLYAMNKIAGLLKQRVNTL
jgi:VanZ family protein